jgi:hypothetical protein
LIFQKASDDKLKSKVGQRKKGTKPPFLRNNAMIQPTPKEPRMTESVGQRPRQEPLQCRGCGENHMFRDFPQRGEKVRTKHHIRQVAIVEHIGVSVPRIYAVLDNKKSEF